MRPIGAGCVELYEWNDSKYPRRIQSLASNSTRTLLYDFFLPDHCIQKGTNTLLTAEVTEILRRGHGELLRVMSILSSN